MRVSYQMLWKKLAHQKLYFRRLQKEMVCVSVELLDILLKCEHLYNPLCKTVWSEDESWENYVERVRVYDPTAHTFKRIHFALLFAHGLEEQSDPTILVTECDQHHHN